MRKKIISAIILIAAGFLCSLMIFDGIDFQILTFSAFFIIALISVNSIEKVGKLFYLTDLIPVFLKGTSEFIGKISFFERFTGFLNKAIEKLGIEYSLNNETAYAVFVYFIVIVVLLFISKK
ncbi:MAG: hypothetical protein IKX58_02980, partial [Clostridia bacterium]|nr:hypothetical protein [Clostridia bacterium]